jgi:plastocyanin
VALVKSALVWFLSLGLILSACAPVDTVPPAPEGEPPTRGSGPSDPAPEPPPAAEETDSDSAPAGEESAPADGGDPAGPGASNGPPDPAESTETRPEPNRAEAESPETSPPAETDARPAPPPEAKPEPEPGDAPPPEPAPEPNPDRAAAELSIAGTIALTGGDADADEAVVYFLPDDPASLPPDDSRPEATEIVTRDKTLTPTVAAVSRGSEVRFPNEDPILHNLFSVSPDNDFDLGVYGPGEAPSVTFDRTGVVNIYCNVHHDMHTHVLVVDTPWRTRPDAQGRFELSGLPPGPGELHVWHRQSEAWQRTIELPASDPVDVTLEVTRPRLPPHRDKTGQPYNRRDRDPYR